MGYGRAVVFRRVTVDAEPTQLDSADLALAK
jgi:hypothetical protein